ncbi:type 4a pilus biogenesis protein PilO [Megamonas hypermegale]|uniref:type 4a pilus biogenesis protein PilO n=1 Tax=Megamonas hypermegale TaxID=158847 RepID=UPI001956462E|nr:type 4a pilus biogenesis protein PilO [Megamonas hypermegale]MBM6833171.1 type 4a pilus biogenesis protein PilO [Megamonas hypermegale]
MTKRDYKYAIMVIGIIFAWLMMMFFCVYKPLSGSINQMNEQIKQQNYELNEMANFIALHNDDLNMYQKQLNTNLMILNQKLPEKLITDELVSKLGDVAQLSNVKITLLKIQPSKMQDNLAIQNIDVALQGDYFSLLSFLRNVSLFQFVTTIQQGTMFVENDSIKCNLTLQIYADNYN